VNHRISYSLTYSLLACALLSSLSLSCSLSLPAIPAREYPFLHGLSVVRTRKDATVRRSACPVSLHACAVPGLCFRHMGVDLSPMAMRSRMASSALVASASLSHLVASASFPSRTLYCRKSPRVLGMGAYLLSPPPILISRLVPAWYERPCSNFGLFLEFGCALTSRMAAASAYSSAHRTPRTQESLCS